MADSPAAQTECVAAKHEAATAAAISGAEVPAWLDSKDEAGTAAAIGADEGRRGGGPPAENVGDRRSHGPARPGGGASVAPSGRGEHSARLGRTSSRHPQLVA